MLGPRYQQEFQRRIRQYESKANDEIHPSLRSFFVEYNSEVHKLPHDPEKRDIVLRRRRHFLDVRDPRFYSPDSESAWDNRAGITASTIDRQMKIYHQFKDHKGEFVGMGRVLNCDPADFRSVKEGDDISCRSSRGFSRTSPLKMRDNDRDSFSAGAPRVVRRQVQTARGPANSETSDLSSQGSAQCKRKVKGEFLKKYTGAGISPFLATAHGLNAPPELLPRGHRNLVSVPVEAGDTYTRVLPAVPPVAQSLDSLAAAQPHMFIPVTIRDRTRRLQPKASEADSSWNNRFHVRPSKNEAKDRVIREYMRY